MQEREAGGRNEEGDDLPEVPETPELPEAPPLTPRLPPRPKAKADPDAEQVRNMGLAYTLPIALAAPIILLTVGGYLLDGRLNSSPWFTLGGALLGSASGLINMIRIANRLNR